MDFWKNGGPVEGFCELEGVEVGFVPSLQRSCSTSRARKARQSAEGGLASFSSLWSVGLGLSEAVALTGAGKTDLLLAKVGESGISVEISYFKKDCKFSRDQRGGAAESVDGWFQRRVEHRHGGHQVCQSKDGHSRRRDEEDSAR